MKNTRITYKQYIGIKGEEAASRLLEDKGYNILKRNYSEHNVGEIDIIAEKNSDIHVFEVRTRMNIGPYPDSAESVVASKRKKIIKTAERFIAEYGLYDRNIIFEIVMVTHDKTGEILKIDFVPF